MKRVSLTVVIFYLALFPYAYGSTAQAGEKHINWFNFVFSVVNFILFVLLLYFLLKKPVKKFLADRSTDISAKIEKAAKEHEDAKGSLEHYEKKLAMLDKEIAEIKKEFLEQAEAGRKDLLEEAENLKKKILADTEKMKESEIEKINLRFKKEVFKLAKEIAEKVIKDNIDEKDQKRLQKEFLEK